MTRLPPPTARLFLIVAGTLLTAIPTWADDTIQWRTDYNAARKEAQTTGKPMLLEVGTENCMYCRKMQATTFQDTKIIELINGQFIPLRVDATQESTLVQALRVQMYPTTVLAGPDGKIHGFLQGYIAADQLKDHAERAVLAVTTPDWVARDLREATKALAAADYTRSVSLLKGVTATAADSPAKTKAAQILAELEQSAADRLARAESLESQGELTASMGVLAQLVRDYAGTEAAASASTRLTGLASRTGSHDQTRSLEARALLATARNEFRVEQYAECLDHCERLADSFAGLPEAVDAATLSAQITGDPVRMAIVCDQLDQRSAAMHLTLADSWMKRGQAREAQKELERVARNWPDTRQARTAQITLTKMQKGDGSVLAGFSKSQ